MQVQYSDLETYPMAYIFLMYTAIYSIVYIACFLVICVFSRLILCVECCISVWGTKVEIVLFHSRTSQWFY